MIQNRDFSCFFLTRGCVLPICRHVLDCPAVAAAVLPVSLYKFSIMILCSDTRLWCCRRGIVERCRSRDAGGW